MSIIQSIVLGIVQGITEFFPISSSGHLVVLPYFLNWDYPPLYFTVTVHFATLAAIVTVFYKEIFRIIRAVILGIFIRKYRISDDFRLGIFLIIASVPAAAVGYFLDDYVESLFSNPLAVAAFLLVTALFLWLGELRGKRVEVRLTNSRNIRGDRYSSGAGRGFNFFTAIMTGIGQAIAIFPGVSRTGATISFARFFGVKRSEAVRFSFLLSVPVILGSFIFELFRSSDIIFGGNLNIILSLVAGLLFSYLAGLFAIRFIVYLTRRKNLNIFAIYCIGLSVVIFIFYIIKRFI